MSIDSIVEPTDITNEIELDSEKIARKVFIGTGLISLISDGYVFYTALTEDPKTYPVLGFFGAVLTLAAGYSAIKAYNAHKKIKKYESTA